MGDRIRSLCRQASGFSLMELMATIAIAAILLGIGLPSFTGLIRSHRLTTAVNSLVADINLARAEAIQRGQRVDMVAVDGDWGKGWVIFIDEDNDGTFDAGESLIFRRDVLPDGMTVTSSLTDPQTYLIFNSTGRPHTRSNVNQSQFGTFRFVLGDRRRNVVLNILGRPRVCTPVGDTSSC